MFVRRHMTRNAEMVNRISRLNDELRQARGQLARYGELLVAIQRSILPQRLPEVRGLDLAVHFVQAERVGGDFYDVQPIGPEHWAIAVSDVSGHGLAAVAVMAMVHALGSALHGHAPSLTPGAVLRLINRPLATRYLANTGQFVTAFVGWYDACRGALTYASAGHPPPRLVRTGQVRRLDAASGLPLGIDVAGRYEEAVVSLLPGDRLVFFTDGMTEATNAKREPFGDARFDAALSFPATTAAGLLRHVVDALRDFRAGVPRKDDETCLVSIVQAATGDPTNEKMP